MDEHRDQTFAAWIEAERLAYDAVHQLHQRTQGGRIAATPEAIAAVLAVRRHANHCLARLSQSHPQAERESRLPKIARTGVRRTGAERLAPAALAAAAARTPGPLPQIAV
ncbi:hypothetical protein PGB34_08580 [Xenophilus arseniciresistens]|uniref:Uncharacterized protein n=1 Tax=Xenophilus arseniciresistens TaxID=1283306 RepID=A0AAE3SZD2_9BURK|nr:hypothetical protein [Xenophilus arseniciresistens]MDA7416420.1 hypothetical protein [Xenophilus arseniciresistens]